MKPFAIQASSMPVHGVREIMDLAWATSDVIHLEVGEPDFATPDYIVEETCRRLRAGDTKYVPNGGKPELRASVARYFERQTGVATGPENILVTPGAVMSLATAFLSLLDPGDEVLLPDPSWPNGQMATALLHGKPVFYGLRPENQFLPDPADLERHITPKTKMLLLCTPSNPTGQVYGPELMQDLMDVARRHDLWVLSDEIYAEIVFDRPHTSALPLDSDGRTLLVSGMSKAFAMTGYRVGFTRACPEYVEIATRLQEPFVSCGSGFSQLAAVAGLDGPMDVVHEMREVYRRRRDVAIEVLKDFGLYRYTPGGAFYLLVDVSASGRDARDFALELIERKKVAVAPGSAFGQQCADHVRVSYASSEENVREGVRRICEMVQEG